MVIIKHKTSIKIDETSYCVIYTGETSKKDIFIPFFIDGEDGKMTYETLNGDIDNSFVMGASTLLGVFEQVDLSLHFIELGFNKRTKMKDAHLICYYNSEIGKKMHRIQIPFMYGLIIPFLMADGIQVVTGNDTVSAIGRDMEDIDCFLGKNKLRKIEI